MSVQPKIGQLVPLKAKPDQGDALSQFLITGYGLLAGDQEPETLQWFALKYNTPEPNYAIFDTYAAESGRQAHISGEVAKALFANADTLLAALPDLPSTNFNLLASKIKPLAGVESDFKKGLTVGLRVLVKAKPEQIDAVREFLQGALPLVEAEPETPVWYAIEFPGTNVFGIVDFFATQGGLDAHLKGKVAEALFANVDKLLVEAPEVITTEVLAVKI
ncbi:hypothetical protein BD311DRAFT_789496 [Dichomitus squalens]|uniref:ABM domain-containing protein n=1 Tax=Dichomitus squalens TaxID=114155 RepID=A0A4Q9MJM8_9APHY|nr:hypothetical protein BD311DRAFT_789496 [Dichomitus squalens]